MLKVMVTVQGSDAKSCPCDYSKTTEANLIKHFLKVNYYQEVCNHKIWFRCQRSRSQSAIEGHILCLQLIIKNYYRYKEVYFSQDFVPASKVKDSHGLKRNCVCNL